MQLKKYEIIIPVFLLFYSFCASMVMGEQRCVVPTVTKNVEGIEDMLKLKLDPNNPDEINAGSSITIKVIDGLPPFNWGEPGNGYSWSIESPTNSRTNQLVCAAGT